MARPALGTRVGMSFVACPQNNMLPTLANNPGSGGKSTDEGPRCTKCGKQGHAVLRRLA